MEWIKEAREFTDWLLEKLKTEPCRLLSIALALVIILIVYEWQSDAKYWRGKDERKDAAFDTLQKNYSSMKVEYQIEKDSIRNAENRRADELFNYIRAKDDSITAWILHHKQ